MERKHNLVINSANNISQEIIVTDNVFYRDTTDNSTNSTLGKNVKLGFSGSPDSNIIFNGNLAFGGSPVIDVKRWKDGDFHGNTISNFNKSGSANNQLINLVTNTALVIPWDNNEYYSHNPTGSTLFDGETFSQWKTRHSLDNSSTFTANWPTNNYFYVHKNVYDPSKYHVTIVNYMGLTTVNLPADSLDIPLGEKYYVRDVQNYFGSIIDSGYLSTSGIDLPMNLTGITAVTGNVPLQAKHTDIYLGTFIIESATNGSAGIAKNKTLKSNLNWEFIDNNFVYKGNIFNTTCSFKLYDIEGKIITQKELHLIRGKKISLPKSLKKGVYFGVFNSQKHQSSKKIIIN